LDRAAFAFGGDSSGEVLESPLCERWAMASKVIERSDHVGKHSIHITPIPPAPSTTQTPPPPPTTTTKQMTVSTSNLLVPPAKKVEQRTLSSGSFPPADAVATIGAPSLAAQARRATVMRSFTQTEPRSPGADAAHLRRRFRTDPMAARERELNERPKWKLTSISEQRVLKAGVTRLHKEQVKPEVVDAVVFPVRPDGSPLMMQSSFMKRLLTGKLELKSCLESDVSAAQMDIRHLNAEQLLEIRVSTLDFSTDSESHSCHKHFLGMVDTQMFTKLARRFLRGPTLPPDHFYKLGVKMALILGAQQVLNDGWAAQSNDCTAEVSLIPDCWAAKMDETLAGHGSGIAIFNTKDCWLEVLPDENPDFQQFGKQIAVVCDRSVGSGPARRLHWEITAMDPEADDILKEMVRKDRGGQRQTQMELTAAIAKHAARKSGKGLVVEKQEGPIEKGSPTPPVHTVQVSPAASHLSKGSPTPPVHTAQVSPAASHLSKGSPTPPVHTVQVSPAASHLSQVSPAASHPSASPRTPMIKGRVSDAILRRMENFTPSPIVNSRSPMVNSRQSLGSSETEKLRKARIITGSPGTHTWQNSHSTRNTLPADLSHLSTLIDEKEAEPLVDEKVLLQQAAANFREICESSEGMAADR